MSAKSTPIADMLLSPVFCSSYCICATSNMGPHPLSAHMQQRIPHSCQRIARGWMSDRTDAECQELPALEQQFRFKSSDAHSRSACMQLWKDARQLHELPKSECQSGRADPLSQAGIQ